MGTEMSTEVKDIFGAGELIKNTSQAITELIPGRKVVSAARAQLRVEEVLDEGIERLRRKAEAERWSSDYLAMRLQGFIESVGRRTSLEVVAGYAQRILGEDDPIDEDSTRHIDSEWLSYFVYHSERATSKDVQAIWGAILAGEINGEGVITKKTMSILADMDKRDAAAWSELCSKCIGGNVADLDYAQPVPMLIDIGERFAMKPEDIDRLRGLGLIEFSLGSTFRTSNTITCQPIQLMQVGEYTLVIFGDGVAELKIVSRLFTPSGFQLAKLCSLGCFDGFEAGIIDHLKSLGFKVAKVARWLEGGKFDYVLLD